jgi:hypothetical protein
MAGYLLGRISGLLLTIFVITIVVFVLMKSVPGGPFVFDRHRAEDEKSGCEYEHGRDCDATVPATVPGTPAAPTVTLMSILELPYCFLAEPVVAASVVGAVTLF